MTKDLPRKLEEKILYLLEILQESYPKGVNKKKLLKDFGKKNLDRIEAYLNNCFGAPPVKKSLRSQGEVWSFGIGGNSLKERLENQKILRSQSKLLEKQTTYSKRLSLATYVLALFTLALVVSGFIIGNKTSEILERQSQILEKTTQSNKADLVLVPSESYRYYSYKIEDLDEPSRERERFPIGIINSGKLMAPFVRVRLVPDQFVGKRDPYYWEIISFDSLNYSYTDFPFNSRYSNLSVGEYNLTFSINCPYCEQPYKEQELPICIYSDYRKAFEECGEKEIWRNGGR